MIGIIITGHGEFAVGLTEAQVMIAGEMEHVKAVRFLDGMPLEDYQQEIENAIKESNEQYDGTLILTDLIGGTPFNTSVVASQNIDHVEILAGTNLSMLLEAVMMTQFSYDVTQVAQTLLDTGKEGIFRYQVPESSETEVFDDEDGI